MIPLGLLLHEIVSNAIFHGLSQSQNPVLYINVYLHDEKLVINIQDNGKGIQGSNTNGLGIELIHLLTEQLNGTIHFSNNNGLLVKLSIPKNEIISNFK